MSTVAVARPPQTLRQRRELTRPNIQRSSTRAGTTDALEMSSAAITEPRVHTQEYILRKFRGCPPSLSIHLYPTYFRFEQQDSTFPYSGPMGEIIRHISNGTVPHNILEELLQQNVPFYDGCLIVKILDKKTGANASSSLSSAMAGNNKGAPGSIHNYNEHITPSPYVPYPKRADIKSVRLATLHGDRLEQVAAKDADKEIMPAPDQPASSAQKVTPTASRIFTKVLFPTPQSLLEEISLLARTPLTDSRGTKRLAHGTAAGRDESTPTTAHPPTPLASVPPTPIFPKGLPSKRQKMVLDDTNIHEFEAQVINATAPPLFLEPTRNLAEQVALLDAMRGPNQVDAPAERKTRKRTTAELAADEAQAAEEERFMLIHDERNQPSSVSAAAGNGGAGEGQGGSAGFEPTFSRFKLLEMIKMQHEEKERQKREEEARQNLVKSQQREAEVQRQKNVNDAEQRQRENQERLAAQRQIQIQNQALVVSQQQEAARLIRMHQAQVAAQAAQQAQSHGQANPHLTNQHAQMQPTSGPQMSPVVRQQTPMTMNSLPVIGNGPMMSQPMSSVPMAPSASQQSQGAGSPARPPSSISHRPVAQGMVRQISAQHSQPPASAHGTPLMMSRSTPNVGHAVPAMVRNMTPQPRVKQHGSPPMAPTGPMPMATPQMGNANFTPQQLAMMRAKGQGRPGMQGPPGQNMSQEQMAHILNLQNQQRAAQLAQQNGLIGAQGTPTADQYRAQQLQHAQRQHQLAMMQRQPGVQNGGPGMSTSPSVHPAMANMSQQQQQNMMAQMAGGQQPQNAMQQRLGSPQVQQPMTIEQRRHIFQANFTKGYTANMAREIEASGGPNGPMAAAIKTKYSNAFQVQFANAWNRQLMGMQRQQHQGAQAGGQLAPQQGGMPQNMQQIQQMMVRQQMMQNNVQQATGQQGSPVDPAYVQQLQATQQQLQATQQQQQQQQQRLMHMQAQQQQQQQQQQALRQQQLQQQGMAGQNGMMQNGMQGFNGMQMNMGGNMNGNMGGSMGMNGRMQ